MPSTRALALIPFSFSGSLFDILARGVDSIEISALWSLSLLPVPLAVRCTAAGTPLLLRCAPSLDGLREISSLFIDKIEFSVGDNEYLW
jgi:hypothetical protein